MTNINGKAYALNLVSPMKCWNTLALRLVFFIISTFKPHHEDFKRLSFVHFLRWVILPRGRFPRLAPDQPREELRHDYLLFCSNFNGTPEQYINAFSEVLAPFLNWIWRWSENYPGAVPVGPLLRYIKRIQVDTDHYYNAYPMASTSDVKAALRVYEAYEELARSSAGLSGAEFEEAWHSLLARIQCDLGSIGPARGVDVWAPRAPTGLESAVGPHVK